MFQASFIPPRDFRASVEILEILDISNLAARIMYEAPRKLSMMKSRNPSIETTVDQACALMLYTTEHSTKKESVYYKLNQVLRSSNRSELTPWRGYIFFLLGGIASLSANYVESTPVYRYMRGSDLLNKYQLNSRVTWFGFSSATNQLNKIEEYIHQTPQDGKKNVVFSIHTVNGRFLGDFSAQQDEILLPFVSTFVVAAVHNLSSYTLVELRQDRNQDQEYLISSLLSFRKRVVYTQPGYLLVATPAPRPMLDPACRMTLRIFFIVLFVVCMLCFGGGVFIWIGD